MVATESAAEARLRDARAKQHPNYHSCDSLTEWPFHFRESSCVVHAAREEFQAFQSDPTLLPTTRAGSDPMDCELGYYHRLAPKTHIGLLCLVIIWLLPLGIILSGGTSYLSLSAYSSIQTTSFEPLTWENMKRAEHCLRFKTRKYMAKSVGNSPGRGGVIECEASSAEIHGVTLHPDYCENLGLWSGIWGNWVIDFDEPDCETNWVNFTDEGCQSTTGRRRLTATLDRFNPDDRWLIMCSTTPPHYELNGKNLPFPSKCQQGTDAVIGIWDISDHGCPSSAALTP
ncbi:hypothetical protein Agabi119p4_4909 [Agaricus bisporus var. burnettii]|uniref:Uncharacterized protein n=1 Tax=Agaricus bisporus var. burnettii TaxID=192524 RepID=A0A8H7F476_AGABI|nr:hypothetical protein Agabi119p4_4909 [Agaricus bisporus var. burnettii]